MKPLDTSKDPGKMSKVPDEVREFLSRAGSKGGKARAAKLSKKRRSDIARQGGLAKAARTNQQSTKFEQ